MWVQTSDMGRMRSVWSGVYTSWTSGTISIKGCKVQKANVQFECLRSIKKQAARNSYSLEASLKRKAGAKKRDQYLQLIEQDSSNFIEYLFVSRNIICWVKNGICQIYAKHYGIKHYFQIQFTNQHNIVGPILLFRKNINTKNTQQIEMTTNAVLDLSKNCLLFSIKGVHGLSKISFWYQCLTSTYIWKLLELT